MAKKARRKMEEDEEYSSFQFPAFDERKFFTHEFEQTTALAIALVLAVVSGLISYLIDRAASPLVVPVVVGIALIAFSPFLVQRLRPLSRDYTKGDWAGLIVTEFFGWLGIWFLLLNVAPIST